MRLRKRLQWSSAAMLLLLALAACQVERPDTVLSDVQMENVLYDYHIAKAMGEEIPYGENYKRVLYVEAAFRKNGITKVQFDSSMVWFSRHPEVLSKIYENVNARLKGEKENLEILIALRDNKPRTSKTGDSIDVWAWQQLYQLSGMPMDNRITFTLPSDSNFQDRDTLRWNVRFLFQGADYDSVSAPVMALQIHYNNDSIIGDMLRVLKAGEHTLSLQGDTLGAIKEVTGFVYYPEQKEQRPLLLNRISLMRYHCTDTMNLAVKDTLEPVLEKKVETIPAADSITKKTDAGETVGSDISRVRPRPSSSSVPDEQKKKLHKHPAVRPLQNDKLKPDK